jgi:hypothetical protein
MKVDIIDYLGKHDGGIIVSISIEMGGDYYDANFFYKEELLAISVEEKLEEKLGGPIEDWEGYDALMLYIVGKVVPYEELINRIDDFDPSFYDLYKDESSTPD